MSPHEVWTAVKCKPHDRCYYSRWKGTEVEALMVTITFSRYDVPEITLPGGCYSFLLYADHEPWLQSTQDQAGSEQVAEVGPSVTQSVSGPSLHSNLFSQRFPILRENKMHPGIQWKNRNVKS